MKYTMQSLADAILEGRGTGIADAYKPWIQITRRTSSPCSNLSVVPMPHLTRLTHYLSRGEREFALLLWWLGATDVREQYPLWPWQHTHPLVQLGEANASSHPGMRVVAKQAGIVLRNYPGLNVPWILTIDLLATVPSESGRPRLVGISCKPEALVRVASPTERELERLELDRRYCLLADIPHRVAHPELLPKTLVNQLHWLAPIESCVALFNLTSSKQYEAYVASLAETVYDRPAWIASREAGKRVGWGVPAEQRAMKVAIWYQHIDVDLASPQPTTRPFTRGGVVLRTEMKRKWLV